MISLRILNHSHQSSPGLPNSRLDLVGRQHKPIRALIPQLIRIRILSLTNLINMINRRAGRRIQRRARRAKRVRRAGNGADSSSRARGDGAVRGVVLDDGAAAVAERPQDVLAVAVHVEVEADAARGAQLVDLGAQAEVLGGVTGGYALVGLGAGARGGAARCGPLVGPVAVDVAAEAAVSGHGLAVLAPEAVAGLGVGEAWGVLVGMRRRRGEGKVLGRVFWLTVWVDDGDDVVVELVDHGLDG